MAELPTKVCTSCGRSFSWRKKWERSWDEVQFCSDKCRRRRVGSTDRALEAAIMDLLAKRSRGGTICPSEVAKVVAGADETQWRPLMEPARSAARRLVAQNRVVITQKGAIVDPSRAKGPIRIRAV